MEERKEIYQIIITTSGKLLMGVLGIWEDSMVEIKNPMTIGYSVHQGLKGVNMKLQHFDPVYRVESIFVKPDIMYYPNKNQIELYLKAWGKDEQ